MGMRSCVAQASSLGGPRKSRLASSPSIFAESHVMKPPSSPLFSLSSSLCLTLHMSARKTLLAEGESVSCAQALKLMVHKKCLETA